MRKFTALLPLIALMGLTACETVQGAGRDMQKAGNAITQEAERAEQKM